MIFFQVFVLCKLHVFISIIAIYSLVIKSSLLVNYYKSYRSLSRIINSEERFQCLEDYTFHNEISSSLHYFSSTLAILFTSVFLLLLSIFFLFYSLFFSIL